jgi:hypothetical protein
MYKRKFGESAYNYVMKTYFWGWRNGDRVLSNVQQDRIILIMPDLLNEKAKNTLITIKEEGKYKLGIEEVVDGIKKTVKFHFRNQRNIYSKDKILTNIELQNIFQKEIERIKQLELVGSYYILDENEKAEVIQIAKYISYIKLQKQIDQIEKDFNSFVSFIELINRGIFTATYDITAFNVKINLTKNTFQEIKILEILVSEIVANSRFKQFSDKYLASELVTINSDVNKSVSSGYQTKLDIKLFYEQYYKLSLSDNDVEIESSFQSESGNLNIKIQMKSIKMLKTSIAKAISRITIYTIIATGFITVAIRNEWFPILLVGGIILIFFYLMLINIEIGLIKHFKAEIKQYKPH